MSNYDKLGNREDVTTSGDLVNYGRNGLNQYTAVDGTSFSYDNNGNLTCDGSLRYYYDYENRLIEVRNLAGTYTMAEYKYDFAGRRVRKITYPGVTAVTKYCYDGDQIIAEYAALQQGDYQLSQYYYGPGIDEPICQGLEYNWFLYYYDGLGNVVAISDGSDILERYEYDVYGKCTVHTGAGEDEEWMTEDDDVADYSVCNPFLFTGRQLDPETGLYYYRARHYHPGIGRFMQTDPIGYYYSMNLYEYCWNNPINWIDPMGLLPMEIIPGSEKFDDGTTHTHGPYKEHWHWREKHTDPKTGKSSRERRVGPSRPVDPSMPSVPLRPSVPLLPPPNLFFPIPLFLPPWVDPWYNPYGSGRLVASLPTRCLR